MDYEFLVVLPVLHYGVWLCIGDDISIPSNLVDLGATVLIMTEVER